MILNFLWDIKNWTYVFDSPVGLRTVVARVPVWCNNLLEFIAFSWSKISFKFISQYFLCLFFTCVFCIYCISIHSSWNVSLVMIENCLWDVYKLDIHICFLHRFVEYRAVGAGCVIALVMISWLTGFKATISIFFCLFLFRFFSAVE